MYMQNASYINKKQDTGSQHRPSPVTIQPELKVGKPDTIYEKQAEEVADEVMMKPESVNEELVQMQPAGEVEELQMRPIEEASESEIQMEAMEVEEMIQEDSINKNTTKGSIPASTELTSKINATRGSGKRLDASVQNEMGHKMNQDFRDVNIHTGGDAAAMSNQIGAKAFTVGNDIYFNQNQYNPNSSEGKHLLAHELTHTVQQGESAKRQMIQKEEDEDTTDLNEVNDSEPQTLFTLTDGTIIKRTGINPKTNPQEGRRAIVKGLSIPSLKSRNSSKFPSKLDLRPYSRQESNTKQGEIWDRHLRSTITRYIGNLQEEAETKGGYNAESQTYFFRLSKNNDILVIGQPNHLINIGLKPFWDKEGNEATFHIDHIVEDQLVNRLDASGSGFNADKIDNLELLEAKANRDSGLSLYHQINARLNSVASDYEDQHGGIYPRPLTAGGLRHGYFVNFEGYDFELSVDEGAYWSYDEISYGEHLNESHLQTISGEELNELGVNAENPVVFLSPTGGTSRRLPDELPVSNWFPRIDLKAKHIIDDSSSDTGSYLIVDAYKTSDDPVSASYEDMEWPLNRIPGIYAWAVDVNAVRSRFTGAAGSLELRGLSPIRIDEFDLTPEGIYARGVVLPTVDFIGDAELAIIIHGSDISMQAEISGDDINMPSPFSIWDSGLIIGASTNEGLFVSGQVNFGIENVGEGFVGASASTSGGFELEGSFNFDSELFDPASISVEYKDEIWTIGGEIGISEGKVRGVKSATITASYSEGNFEASGDAELDIPGIERGTMNIQYSDEGFSIGGAFDLSSDIPGIQSGSVEATVSKQSDDEEYSVLVRGTAQPDIPGINTSLSVEYDNGALTIAGSASYSRGMLSGEVSVGATNRAINEDGMPDGEPDDTMRVYGGGSLTLRLTPWLEATAGVKFLPNGEMEVHGRIGLPSVVDVFPRKQIRRNLFTVPTIEIPLFAIPLGPRSIGLVAQIGGGLDFEAGFGPGQLRELFAEITYNPDREDETTLHGRGVFAIPADAGLTLRGDLGLGISVAIASLTGGIELEGKLGLEGEAAASVDVNWTPQTGIELDAEGSVTVNPKFEFNVNAFARGTLGVGWLSVSKTWRHRLAAFSWGPDIQFGLVFPIQYKEGEPFDLSFSDIEVIYPELNIPQMAKGLASDIKNDIF